MDIQQGDVKLIQTNDDGDINIINGVTEMSGGLETTVYLALFGGNEDDNGIGDTPHQKPSPPSAKYSSKKCLAFFRAIFNNGWHSQALLGRD